MVTERYMLYTTEIPFHCLTPSFNAGNVTGQLARMTSEEREAAPLFVPPASVGRNGDTDPLIINLSNRWGMFSLAMRPPLPSGKKTPIQMQ
jgi:hypothetical protein